MFALKFIRLLASIAIEASYNIFCLSFSLLPGRRNAIQEKMKKAMCRIRSGAPCWALAFLLIFAGGCSSCPPGKPLGAEFESTFYLLRETQDPGEELSKDLYTIFGPEWGEFMDTICRLSN